MKKMVHHLLVPPKRLSVVCCDVEVMGVARQVVAFLRTCVTVPPQEGSVTVKAALPAHHSIHAVPTIKRAKGLCDGVFVAR